jgi:hypothetical protein
VSYPTKTESLFQKVEIEYDGSNNPIYVGVALPGTATSSAGWRIAFLTYDGSNNCTSVTFANSAIDFSAIWDNRAGYTYG